MSILYALMVWMFLPFALLVFGFTIGRRTGTASYGGASTLTALTCTDAPAVTPNGGTAER